MVICLERGADWFYENGSAFLMPAYPGCPGKRPLNESSSSSRYLLGFDAGCCCHSCSSLLFGAFLVISGDRACSALTIVRLSSTGVSRSACLTAAKLLIRKGEKILSLTCSFSTLYSYYSVLIRLQTIVMNMHMHISVLLWQYTIRFCR